jgi:hypothetical protein
MEGLRAMDISEIKPDTMYKCDYDDAQFFGRAKEIKDGKVSVVLGDKINEDGDRGDPVDRRGDTPVWLAPENIHPMAREL